MISVDSVSCARGDARAELALQRRQRRQVQVGGDRLDAEQQRQHHDDGAAGIDEAGRARRGRWNLGHAARVAAAWQTSQRALLSDQP